MAFTAEGLKLGKRKRVKRVPKAKMPKVDKRRAHKVKPAVLRAAYEALAEGGWDIFDAVAKRGKLSTDHLKQLAIHKGVYEGPMGINRMLLLKALSTAELFADERASHAAGNGFGVAALEGGASGAAAADDDDESDSD